MVECPHCHENGVGFFAKLWSDSACPATCRLCGKPSYLSTSLANSAGFFLQALGLVAIIAAFLLWNWWPIISFGIVVISTYALIGLRVSLVPISKYQAYQNKKHGNIFLFIVIAFSVVGFVYASIGLTPSQTAKILIEDRKNGGRVLDVAKHYGDRILIPLKEQSDDFILLDNRNSFWVADILASNQSDLSKEISHELYGRSEYFPKLVGAVGLAANGELTDKDISAHSFLVKTALREIEYYLNSNVPLTLSERYDELAVIALGKTKNKNALSFLMKRLELVAHDVSRAHTVSLALGELGYSEAVPVLRNYFSDDNFLATSGAFKALSMLNDPDIVTIAIKRYFEPPKDKTDILLMREIERYTGKKYGDNKQKWEKWLETRTKSKTKVD